MVLRFHFVYKDNDVFNVSSSPSSVELTKMWKCNNAGSPSERSKNLNTNGTSLVLNKRGDCRMLRKLKDSTSSSIECAPRRFLSFLLLVSNEVKSSSSRLLSYHLAATELFGGRRGALTFLHSMDDDRIIGWKAFFQSLSFNRSEDLPQRWLWGQWICMGKS